MAGTSTDPAGYYTPWPAFDVDEDTVFTPCTELPEVQNLPTFDIRNGDPSDARSMLIKATIPLSYHWVPISSVAPADATKVMEGYIKSHIDHLEANPPAGTTQGQRRKLGICLGVSRAVSTSMYSLSPVDLIPGEVTESLLVTNKDTTGAFSLAPRPTLPEERKLRLSAALNLTDTEKSVVASLVTSAIGIIPLQGYSLIMTQHHYLSAENTQSRKAYAVVEKQFWKGTAVATWFNDDLALIQDAMWHKSCHPVNVAIKEATASDDRVATMIRSAGAGSAASRLPAVEPEVRAANSYRTLMATVSPLFEIATGRMDYGLLQTAMDVVKAFPVNNMNPGIPAGLPAVVPPQVKNRVTARAWLGDIVTRNSDKAAFCFGFYSALSDQNQTLGGMAGTDTLKTSFSLSKLKTQSYAAFVSGQQFYSDYISARKAMRDAGQFAAPSFTVE